MTDDAFRLTPQDVRAQRFSRSVRGLDPREVEDFLRRVADEFERALRDRVQLDQRLRSLQEQLASFREREQAMNQALIAAQELREESRTAADRAREELLREARREADVVRERAEGEARLAQERVGNAERQFAAYIKGFRALLERQLAEVEMLDVSAGAAAPGKDEG